MQGYGADSSSLPITPVVSVQYVLYLVKYWYQHSFPSLYTFVCMHTSPGVDHTYIHTNIHTYI